MKNIISEMKNTQEGIDSRLDKAEDQISNLENQLAKTSNQQKKRKKELFKTFETLSITTSIS